MSEPRLTIAPGAIAALTNRNDRRAYHTFTGDLNQMGVIYVTLLQAGYPVVKSDVYPGFTKDNEEKYKEALAFLYENRIEGWWNQHSALIRNGICTEEEYSEALKKS